MKEITIGGKSIRLHANAATPLRYKMIFGKDIIVEINRMNKGIIDEGELIDLATQIAFVMNMQAEKTREEISKISKSNLIDWLEDFDGAMSFANVANDIMDIYLGNEKGDSKSKKEEDLPSESSTQQSTT